MKRFCLILLCTTLCFFNSQGQSLDNYSESEYDLISDEEIKARLSSIQNEVIKPKFVPAVRSYIKTYTVKRRDRTEAMLGRTAIYYPMFEKMLAESGLPTDLKYLSVVESALNAKAVSRSGAVGLWQFMPATGRECGLKINRTVDERMDPEKATQAAIKYLTRLYKRYNNWELALAAYNGGPGRVNRAIKRGRSKNFWKIRRYLPRETRSYVPAYIAATYVNHYYNQHELTPLYPDTDFQLTETIKVYTSLNFADIAAITGTPEYVIEFLNPSYKRKYIPASSQGNNLVLPQTKMAAFKNTYQLPDSERTFYTSSERIEAPESQIYHAANSSKLYYNVESGDNIADLANDFHCSANDIMKWNKLTSRQLRKGQSLVIYFSRTALQPVDILEPIPLIESSLSVNNTAPALEWKPIELPQSKKKKKRKNKKTRKAKKDHSFIYHKIKRGETLFTIAAQYEGVTANDLVQLNSIESGEEVQSGKKIKIKTKK